MKILVTGATGYIGGRLVPALLDAEHDVRCLARTPAKLDDVPWRDRVEVAEGDLTDADSLRAGLDGTDAAYFLVHSMGGVDDFAEADRKAAAAFRDAAADAGCGRIVYLGGLGDDDDPDLSPHLTSRHEVGEVLADGPVAVTELRAAVIIGSGSASFEMLRSLVEVLPAMVTPKWVSNRCQPIAIRDVLTYLVAALDHPGDDADHVYEVGGADVLTYADMMRTYARVAGLHGRVLVSVPVLSPSLSSHWIGLVTPLPTGLARPLVESLVNEVVVTDRPISAVVDHEPVGFERSLELALRKVADLDVATRWSDAGPRAISPADPQPNDPDWAGGRLLVDERSVRTDATPAEVFAVLEEHAGRRRWRVEEKTAPECLRLRADHRWPGEAWAEWRVEPDGSGARLRHRALFHPHGLWGRVWWYGPLPVRHAVLAWRVRRMAAQTDTNAPSSTDSSSRSTSAA